MSNMKELYEKVAADSTLQDKFAAIMKGAEEAGKEVTEEKLIAFAKEAGYNVTLEEMQVFFKDLLKTPKRILPTWNWIWWREENPKLVSRRLCYSKKKDTLRK